MTGRRKPGPAPGTVGAGRTALLRVRVSPEERDAWQVAAESEGVPLSEWARDALNGRAGSGSEVADGNQPGTSESSETP